MAFSHRSDKSQTRFSTPEPDLDDHRFQQESLPPPHDTHIPARRGTLASIVDGERPQRLALVVPQTDQYGSVVRDFEHAIDDGQSIQSKKSNRSDRFLSPPADERHREDRGSNEDSCSPMGPRRAHFRRPVHNRRDDVESIRSAQSDRSTSPPNSVDAFAPPRRPRAGTSTSRHPSADNGSLKRNSSVHSAARRQSTFDNAEAAEEFVSPGLKSDLPSRVSSVQDDVCFPPAEPPNTYTIDFEDLEEFVSQPHTKTPVAHPFMPHFTRHNEQHKMVFQDKRPHDTVKNYLAAAESFLSPSVEVRMDEKIPESDSSDEFRQRLNSYAEHANRWTFFSSEIDETIHAPELGGLLMPGETFRDLFELGPEGGVWWLDMLNPSEEEIMAVCAAFRVHPLTREDITTQETREKVELFKSYYFLCFRSFYALDTQSEDYLEPINIYAVVFREGLLTFSFCPNQHVAQVRKRIGRLRDYVNLSADWICYALIDEIVDSFGPVLRELEIEADTIEDSVFTARFEDSRNMLQMIGECRKRIMALLRLLGGKADVIKSFAKKCNDAHTVAPRGDVGLYLSDVQDHIVTMMSNLGHFEKMLSRSHTNHLAQITLQHTEQGSRSNELLGKITILATVLVPMNLVAGLFGMNVHVPGQGVDGYGWWFGIVGIVFAFGLICVVLAKRFKFI